MSSASFLVALMLYSMWNIWVISDRTRRYSVEKYPVKFTLDVGYFVLMVFLLSQGSMAFLVLGFISAMIHIFFGVFVEFFHPVGATAKFPPGEIMESYWNYVVIDGAITLLTFGITTIGRL